MHSGLVTGLWLRALVHAISIDEDLAVTGRAVLGEIAGDRRIVIHADDSAARRAADEVVGNQRRTGPGHNRDCDADSGLPHDIAGDGDIAQIRAPASHDAGACGLLNHIAADGSVGFDIDADAMVLVLDAGARLRTQISQDVALHDRKAAAIVEVGDGDAVACAIDALERSQVQRIVLTRPAVEAGERLGFLPGDLAQKVDPYLRPLYDALYDLMGLERVTRAFEKGTIEVAPLAFMRGRTLNNAFVILDEAQNTTPEQMKMYLTRIGFGAKAVVTGDVSQIDLPRGALSGLVDAERVLRGVRGIATTYFTSADVVRHPLVARVVEAYDKARAGHA